MLWLLKDVAACGVFLQSDELSDSLLAASLAFWQPVPERRRRKRRATSITSGQTDAVSTHRFVSPCVEQQTRAALQQLVLAYCKAMWAHFATFFLVNFVHFGEGLFAPK